MTITDEAIYDMIANGVTTTLTGDIEIDTGLPERLRTALTAALEGREEPDATAAYMAGFERGKEAATAEERERCARVAIERAASWDRWTSATAAGDDIAAAIRGGTHDPR